MALWEQQTRQFYEKVPVIRYGDLFGLRAARNTMKGFNEKTERIRVLQRLAREVARVSATGASARRVAPVRHRRVTAYLVRRLLAVIPVMAVVVTVVFLLIHLIPGDPVSVMLGPDATPTQIEATRAALGLDRPLHEQLLQLLRAASLRGDLGQSYFLDRPVTTALVERAEPTLVLTALRAAGGGGHRRALGHRGRRPPRLDLGPRPDARLAARRLRARVLARASTSSISSRCASAGCPPPATPRVFADPVSALALHGAARGLARLQPVGPDRAHQPLLHAGGARSRTTSAPRAPRACPSAR